MSNELQLVKSEQFDDLVFDCYQEEPSGDRNEFWATREQIGQLLGYAEPRKAIGKIHERNKERMDKFSRMARVVTNSKTQLTTLYNFQGFLEICRYSRQPRANLLLGVLWKLADNNLEEPSEMRSVLRMIFEGEFEKMFPRFNPPRRPSA